MNWPRSLLALGAMTACLAASPARAPGAPPSDAVAASLRRAQLAPPAAGAPANLGAADLFAALTEPDRSSEIDALRAIRRALATADSPQARDAARDQVDSLLDLEERRQPDVPPALVMSSLASRIDGAIASLEQAARTAPAPGGGAVPVDALPAPIFMVALAVFAAAAAFGAAFGTALVGKRRLAQAMAGAREDFLAATQRLNQAGAVMRQAQAAAAPSVDEAAGAVRDATLATARLTSAAMEMDVRLRDCIDAAAARQAQAAEVTAECESFTRNLPTLLAGALDMVEARGLPVLEKATLNLQDSASAVAESMAAWPDILAELRENTAAAAAQTEGLAPSLRQAQELAGVLPEIAASFAASAASLRHDVQALAAVPPPGESAMGADAPARLEMQEAQAAALDKAVRDVTRFEESLTAINASLADSAALLQRETRLSEQTLAAAGAAFATATATAQRMAEQQETCLQRLHDAATSQAGAAADLPALIRTLCQSADALQAQGESVAAAARAQTEQCAQNLRHMDEAAGVLPLAALTLEQAAVAATAQFTAASRQLRDESEQRAGAEQARTRALETLIGQAESTLAGLPENIDRLALLGAALPDCVAKLQDAGAGLLDNAAAIAEAGDEQRRSCRDMAHILAAATGDWPLAAAALREAAGAATGELGAAAETVQRAAILFGHASKLHETRLETLTAQAEAAAGALPAEANQLAAVAACLRHEAAVLADAGATVASASCGAASVSPAIMDRLETFCVSLAESQAGIGTMARMQQEALDSVAASRQAGEALDIAARAACAHIDAAARSAGACEADRMAGSALQESLHDIAARMETLLASGEDQVTRMQAEFETRRGAPRQGEVELATLRAAMTDTMAAADRLAKQSNAHAAAAERAVQQALRLAEAAAAAPPQTGLASVASVNGQTRALLAAAGNMAELALRGEAGSLPRQVVAETPALLAAIEASIEDLRGAATALALASDTALLAA